MPRTFLTAVLGAILVLNGALVLTWSATAGPGKPATDAEVADLYGGQTGDPSCQYPIPIECDSCDGTDPQCIPTRGVYLYGKDYFGEKYKSLKTCTYVQNNNYFNCGFVMVSEKCYKFGP